MKRYQNNLLAGVAALALVAGSGLASAQDQTKDHGKTPQAAQPMKSGQTKGEHAGRMQPQGTTDRTAQEGVKHGEKKPNLQENAKGEKPNLQQNAKNPQPGGENHAQRLNKGRTPGITQNENRGGHLSRTTAERRREHPLRGLQGNATGQLRGNNNTSNEHTNDNAANNVGERGANNSNNNGGEHGATEAQGVNVHLSAEQRTHIRQTVIEAHNAPRVGHVSFGIRVGTAIPRDDIRTIHVVPVPETLVRIEPRWRSYEYFVFRDEIVIVNPRHMTIVAVLPV